MPAVDMRAHIAAAARLFRVPTDPDLTRAQFDAFSKQIPLLYFILITNTIAVAYTYVPLAPASLSMIVPAVFLFFMIKEETYADPSNEPDGSARPAETPARERGSLFRLLLLPGFATARCTIRRRRASSKALGLSKLPT